MENEKKFESVYSSKVRAGKRRTYFFDVRQTKGEDYYITITESTKRFDGNGYERHKIFLYKEDFNRFLNSLNDTVDHVKSELMPDFDYELYERRQQEWEEKLAAEALAAEANPEVETEKTEEVASEETPAEETVAETTEDAPAEDAPAEDAAAEDAPAEDAEPEDANSEEVSTEETEEPTPPSEDEDISW